MGGWGSINDEFITDSNGEEIQTPAIELLRNLGDQYNITMVIIDSFSNTPVVASTRDVKFMMDRVFQYMVGRNNPRTELILEEDNYTIQKTYDSRSKSFYLESWGTTRTTGPFLSCPSLWQVFGKACSCPINF